MVRCVNCIWFDPIKKECIAFSEKIRFPRRRRVCILYNRVPKTVVDYAESMDKLFKEDQVRLDSYGIRNYLKKHKLVNVRRWYNGERHRSCDGE